MNATAHRPILLLATLAVCGQGFSNAQNAGTPPANPDAAATAESTDRLSAGEMEERPDFPSLKAAGAKGSRYLTPRFIPDPGESPVANLTAFRDEIEPILRSACLPCHGPDKQKGGVRVDELDPNLVEGEDIDWWLDVQSVLTNGEMPPPDKGELSAEDRGRVIEWLAKEVQTAAALRRGGERHSALRRMTRYEYEYALQDLLGLPFSFADDLPPDPTSEDGFQNSAELLHLSPMQLEAYFESNRKALNAAAITGDRPAPVHWDISMEEAALAEFARQDNQVANARKSHGENPEKLEEALARLRKQRARRPGGAHYESLVTGRLAGQSWNYNEAKFAWAPAEGTPEGRAAVGNGDLIAVIPEGRGMILELGDQIPDRGTLRVRVLASRATRGAGTSPTLRLDFGWQASNDSRAVLRTSESGLTVDALAGAPSFYEFNVPLPEVKPRNWVRKTAKMGELPSPSEYIKLVNSGLSGGPIRVHHVAVEAPAYDQWPPASHLALFPAKAPEVDDASHARNTLADFMGRAWRRTPTDAEIQRKLDLLARLQTDEAAPQTAMIEVMATVLTSPNFLFVGASPEASEAPAASPSVLATRLSMFLWCSTPDEELLSLAGSGALADDATLLDQVDRMLADPRSERFPRHFVRQWLGMSLLDFLSVDKKLYPEFDGTLRASMAREPVAFFGEVLGGNLSVLEFLHADFAMVDERLARHYGIEGVSGDHFRRVDDLADPIRGGLLTQAGLLAMNSDGTDSHPLKRGVWMLERLLDDPPPPPPPAVPEIDLADPEIAKMTLKERIEDHRNDPACMSCHAKIDPWGVAFENYDASGSWRTEIAGKPVDATSVLFNGQELDGMGGLKGFLLENRQDQFVRALVHKLTAYALGRPLSFEDRAAVDEITAEVRRGGDGLATMIKAIVSSELFRSR